MSFITTLFNGLKDGLEAVLRLYEGLLEPFMGQYAWGVSIILLTLTVRLFLVPLAVRQTKSMRAMQQLQPQLKKIQKKYEVDRSVMKTDPERYKAMKEKQREAQMALYQEHQVNPVGGCLPLILQMPIFFALFSILRSDGSGAESIPELATAPFLGIDSLAGTAAAGAGIGAILLVALQVFTTYYSTRQMQGRNTGPQAAEQQQAQKLMMYIMPVFLGYLSWTFPIGVVLYWVTTNVWTIGQQAFIFKQVEAEEARAAEERAQRRLEAKGKRGAKGSERGQGTDSGSEDTTPKKSKPTPSKGDRGSEGGSGNARNAKGNGTNGGRSGNGRSQDGRSQNSPAQNGRKRTPNGKVNGTKSSRSNKPDSSQGTPKATQ